eukprot:TRINITY_DN14251_c0_g2_i1.p2 TRINITY_DN14251_c0_g2~~TRINITY_DN14251_c0_g2_i1.p2  ORF type:complete len:101 (+),score=2.32 TRINITY_DN14251_c0_g2_i1:45-305(+)
MSVSVSLGFSSLLFSFSLQASASLVTWSRGSEAAQISTDQLKMEPISPAALLNAIAMPTTIATKKKRATRRSTISRLRKPLACRDE